MNTKSGLLSGNNFLLGSYLKVMTRNMVRKKSHTFINILGLTTGITLALLLGIFIWSQLQVNRNLQDVERLYFLEVSSQVSIKGFNG
jgi:hypothetical protein